MIRLLQEAEEETALVDVPANTVIQVEVVIVWRLLVGLATVALLTIQTTIVLPVFATRPGN